MRLHLIKLRLLQSRPVRRWMQLRARAARWLYGTPTKLLEVLNALMLLTWVGTPGVRDVIAKMTRGPE